MSFTRITTAGAGTMGSQVAWQMAFHGKDVTVYDAIPDGSGERQGAAPRVRGSTSSTHRGATQAADRRHLRSPRVHDRPGGGGARCRSDQRVRARVHDHQGVVLARGLRARSGAHRVHDQHLDPAAERAGRLRRPAGEVPGLHFAIGVWDSNIGEVMGHPGTDTAVFERVLEFAEEIGLVPDPASQGAERLRHQQPARAVVHRRARAARAAA